MKNNEPVKINSNEVDLELRGIRVTYGENVAVEDLSLQVMRGEFLFLLGPSGCGKTTTLRSIAGFIQPQKGNILIRGRDVSRIPSHKRDLGMVFQDYALFPHMSVYENLAFGLRMRKFPKHEWKQKIERTLELVQLQGMEVRYPKQLSGGQQQRVALARALVIEPTVLLLDEPLSNLDLKLRQQMRIELRQLQEKLGITTIFVTHDQEEALSMGDRIAVMEDGRISQLGKPKEIYQSPQSRFIADFIGESNFFKGKIAQLTDSGRAEVSVGKELVLVGIAPESVKIEQQINIAVRPEKIILSDSANPEYPNCIQAKVLTSVFNGSYIRLQVKIAEGLFCTVQQQNSPGIRNYERGDEVYVAWAVEDNLLIVK